MLTVDQVARYLSWQFRTPSDDDYYNMLDGVILIETVYYSKSILKKSEIHETFKNISISQKRLAYIESDH